MKLKTATNSRKCNAFSTVWAAIYGCEGHTKRWHYVAGHFGRREAEFVCPTCEAVQDAHKGLSNAAYQQRLTDAEAKAGVEDYRTAKTRIVNGRPVLA